MTIIDDAGFVVRGVGWVVGLRLLGSGTYNAKSCDELCGTSSFVLCDRDNFHGSVLVIS